MKKIILSFTAIIITNAVVAQIPTDSLKLNYPFNNNSLDVSGNNLHGINNGVIITQDRFNNQNSAYRFNGSSDYIEVPNDSSIKPDFPFTVSIWFKINEFSTTSYRLYSSDLTTNSYSGFWLSCGNDGSLSAGYGNGLNGLSPSNRVTKKMLYQVSKDIWYNYTVVFNELNDIDLYLNCNEEVGTYSGGSSSMVNNGSPGQIGHGHTTTSYFNGIIDDIRIYNKSLDSLEVDSLCNESNPILGIKESINSSLIKIYPNPTDELINVKIDDYPSSYLVRILNSYGQKMMEKELNVDGGLLDINDLSPGIYFVHILNQDDFLIGLKKVIVE